MKKGKVWWPLLLRALSLSRNIHRAGEGKRDKLREKWIFPFFTSSCGESFCSESLSQAGQELLGGSGQALSYRGIIMPEQAWILPQLGKIFSQFYPGKKKKKKRSFCDTLSPSLSLRKELRELKWGWSLHHACGLDCVEIDQKCSKDELMADLICSEEGENRTFQSWIMNR